MHIGRRDQKRTAFGARLAFVFILVVAALAASATGAMAMKKKKSNWVAIVTQGTIPTEHVPLNTHYFSTLQGAVNAAPEYSWILVEPGIYKEEVKVTTSNLHIRGMDRNKVIFDGTGIKHEGKDANGIEVSMANNVWIENMTARNFERAEAEGGGGNDFWWNGGTDSDKVGAHGWWGSYLTAYDTGLNGGYGIFTQNETEGAWNHIYSSGFNDSGIYIGACQECKALVNHATIENNAVGYSGSNSGGSLVIENSRFAHNSDGIVPNGENPGDGPPGSNGECHQRNYKTYVPGKKPNPTPHIRSTQIERCEIFRKNVITENNNLTVPANGSTIKAPYGAGIQLPGVDGVEITENEITNNPSDGVMAFEYPNPFSLEAIENPEIAKKQEEERGYPTIFFQLSGDKIAKNTFAGNGEGKPYQGDVFMFGGVFSPSKKWQSQNDCVGTGAEANTFTSATYPAQSELETKFSCTNANTPNPDLGIPALFFLLENQTISENDRTITPQPAPGEQETMPNACENVPQNPLCPNNEPYARRHARRAKARKA